MIMGEVIMIRSNVELSLLFPYWHLHKLLNVPFLDLPITRRNFEKIRAGFPGLQKSPGTGIFGVLKFPPGDPRGILK